jgi:hypothetical protein
MKADWKDLGCIAEAARTLGLEFVHGQKTYDWYGRKVGNDPLPEGFTVEDLGKCDHAIRIPGNERSYEIGVAERRDGQPGYTLLWDNWNGGYGLTDKVGQNGERLVQEYGVQVATKHVMMEGYIVSREVFADGHVILKAVQ